MPSQPVSTQIRLATREDLPALYRLAQQSLTLDLFSDELLAEKLFFNPWKEPSTWETYVAELAGEPVGFLQNAIRPTAPPLGSACSPSRRSTADKASPAPCSNTPAQPGQRRSTRSRRSPSPATTSRPASIRVTPKHCASSSTAASSASRTA